MKKNNKEYIHIYTFVNSIANSPSYPLINVEKGFDQTIMWLHHWKGKRETNLSSGEIMPNVCFFTTFVPDCKK